MSTSAQQLFTNRQHLTTKAYDNSANLNACKSIYQYQPGVSWVAVLVEVKRIVTAEINAHGAFRVQTMIGVLVCR